MRLGPQHVLAPLLLMAALATGQGLAEEPEFLVQTSSGSHELAGERLLVVEEIPGTLSLRLGKPGLLRFEGRSLDSRRGPREVALWRSGEKTLLLGPAGGQENENILIDMTVPPEVDVEVYATGGRILISGLHGDVSVEADEAAVQVRGVRGAADLLLEGGQLVVDGVAQSFSYKGTDVNAKIMHLDEGGELDLDRGRLELSDSSGEIGGSFESTAVGIDRVQGFLRLEGSAGSLRVGESGGGGELRLSETPLALRLSQGDLNVRTDATVEFAQHDGPLTILGYGSSVRGADAGGPLKIETDSAEVALQGLTGECEVSGSGLTLTVSGTKGPLTVRTNSSEIVIEKAMEAVTVENEYGDIEVREGKGRLKIDSLDGNVRVSSHDGPMQLTANGPEVEVSWDKFSSAENVTVLNKGGDVRLELPQNGRCQLRLEAPYGRVETDVGGIRVSDDRHSASGEFTGGRGSAREVKKHVIQATSGGGNVYLETRDGEN